MRTPTVKALLLLASVGVPLAASGSVSLLAGYQYSQFDTWVSEGSHSTSPHFDLNLGLQLRGFVAAPDVAQYDLSAAYRRIGDRQDGVKTGSIENLTYGGRVSALQNRTSPIGLTLYGARAENDFATNPAANAYGHGVTNSAGASAALQHAPVPLSASYSWSATTSTIPGMPVHDSTRQTLMSRTGFSSPAVAVDAQYTGSFNEGSWTADNFDTHDVVVNARTGLGGGTELDVDAIGSARQPTAVDPAALLPGVYATRSSGFRARWFKQGEPGDIRSVGYSYTRVLNDTPGSPLVELIRQSATAQSDLRLNPETVFTRLTLDLSVAQDRSGPTELRGTGETVGAELWWRERQQASVIEVHGGPRLGLTQSEGTQHGGSGAVAGLRVNRPLGSSELSFDYNGSYSRDLYGSPGWNLAHGLSASLTGSAWAARYSAMLRAAAYRTYAPIVGDGVGRSLDALGSLTSGPLTCWGSVAYTSGMIGSTSSGFVGDGLLIPARFNSSTLDAKVELAYRLFPGLRLSSSFRLARTDVPGIPALRQAEAYGALDYTFGAFGASLTDRVSRFETVTGWDTANAMMFNVYRSFAW